MIHMSRFRKLNLDWLLAFGIYLTMLIVVFYPAIKAPSGQMLFGDDLFRSYGFFRQFFTDSIKAGIIPFWNPYLFSGYPFLANPSVGFLYPPNWLYIVLPLKYAFLSLTLIHLLWGMMGMYFLGRYVIKPRLSLIPATMGGLVFGLSGYFMARVWAGHTEIISASSWIPWVFGVFWHIFEKSIDMNQKTRTNKPLIIASIFLALQIYAGYQTIALFTLEAVGIIAIIFSIIYRSWKPVVLLIITVSAGLGLSALQLIPNLEFLSYSIRTYDFPYQWALKGAYTIESLKQMLSPFIMGDQYTFFGPPPNYHEQAAFVTSTTIGLTLVGIVFSLVQFFKNKNKILFTFLCTAFVTIFFGLWVSLGDKAPVNLHYLLWKFTPFYKSLRIPARHLILMVLGLSALGGIGLNAVRNKIVQIGLVAIIFLELVPFARHFVEVRPVPGSSHDRELIQILKKDQDPVRYLPNFGVWVSPRDALDFDSASNYGIYSVTGYDPSIISSYYRFIDAINGKTGSSLEEFDVQIPYINVNSAYIDFLNIKYVMVPQFYDPIAGGNQDAYTLIKSDEAENYKIYENKSYLSRFFLVPTVKTFIDNDSIKSAIAGGEADLSREIAVTESEIRKLGTISPDCPSLDKSNITVVGYSTNSIELKIYSPCNSFLATSEVMYPGWQATIDGVKTPVITTNLAFRSLYMPKGEHVVVFKFVPRIFYIGGIITLITGIILLLIKLKLKS